LWSELLEDLNKVYPKATTGIWDTLHTVLSLKDSAEAVAGSSVFPHSPPIPFHRFPKGDICRPGGAHVWGMLKVQMGSWPHIHSPKGGTNCDYLALPPPAPGPFLNEALSPHIPHLRLPTISLKTLIFLFFRDYFHLFYPWCFSEHCFCFFFILCAFLILLYHFLSHISSIHKSTENNINIVNTHVPATFCRIYFRSFAELCYSPQPLCTTFWSPILFPPSLPRDSHSTDV